MTLWRLRDDQPLHDLLKRPEIAELDHGFDPGSWIANHANVALTDGENVALFEARSHDVFEGHVLFAARGRKALDLGRHMLDAMFDLYGAFAIYGLTPIIRPQARWFNRKLGFESLGMVERPQGVCELFYMSNKGLAS